MLRNIAAERFKVDVGENLDVLFCASSDNCGVPLKYHSKKTTLLRYVHFRASTTIGIASEVLRLALARTLLLDENFVVVRVGWPKFLGRQRYPDSIYSVLVACGLKRERGPSYIAHRIVLVLEQIYEYAATRIFRRSIMNNRDPFGQEGLLRDSKSLSDRIPAGISRFGVWRRTAKSVRNFGPVTLIDSVFASCESRLSALGVSSCDWFVCLHVRTSSFHADDATWRNSTFNNYRLLIEEVIRRGGKVVRLGDEGHGIVTCPMPGLIDYPNTQYKSEVMDLYLIKRCRFYVGTPSGILDTAYLFRTPTLSVNSVHFDFRSTNPTDRVLYKKVFHKSMNRELTTFEALECCRDILSNDWFNRYDFIENSEFELHAALCEFADVLDGRLAVTARQVRARRYLVRKKLEVCSEHGLANSLHAASIAFAQCHIIDFSLI